VDTLYRSHGAAILRRAHQLLGCEAEAEEVLQDVFASLLQHPDQFRGHSSVMTYLYRMTTNAALGRIRSEKNRRRLLGTHHGRHVSFVGQAQETHARLRELLGRLPEELAQLATYYYLDEMTQDEIAEVLGCSRQWVGKLLGRLRRHQERSG
jgi:RNA polymerase sigma-70 factor (ECF subfamily)